MPLDPLDSAVAPGIATAPDPAAAGAVAAAAPAAADGLLRRTLRYPSARIGLALVAFAVLVAFAGPLVAPHTQTEVVGLPFQPSSSEALLGTDAIGRDVFSRILYGGDTVLLLAVVSTVLPYLIGAPLGLRAGLRGGAAAAWLMRGVDVLLAFPALIFVLILLTGLGSRLWVIVLAVTLILIPRVIRLARASGEELSTRGFVEAAELRGERALGITVREILPNALTPLLADFGVRFANITALIASLSFLGFGLQPPGADWGAMIYENRTGLTLQAWSALGPAVMIAVLVIGANLLADATARAAGRTADTVDRAA